MSRKILKKSESKPTNNLTVNLLYLMKSFEIESFELSQLTGIALTTINGLKKGTGNPTLSTLQILSDFFKVSVGELTEGNISTNSSNCINVKIPLVEIQEFIKFLENPNDFNSSINIESDQANKKYIAVKISNNSLMPFFEKGTIFIITSQCEPQDGDIVLVQFNKSSPCFRKIFIEGDSHIFSNISGTIEKDIVKTKNYKILGVVIKAIQNFYV